MNDKSKESLTLPYGKSKMQFLKYNSLELIKPVKTEQFHPKNENRIKEGNH